MIDGHECKKIQVDFKNQQARASLSKLYMPTWYMGTYDLSGYINGKPTWSSLSASIWINQDNYWIIGDIRNHGVYSGNIVDHSSSEWPTESKTSWKLLTRENEWVSVDEDITHHL